MIWASWLKFLFCGRENVVTSSKASDFLPLVKSNSIHTHSFAHMICYAVFNWHLFLQRKEIIPTVILGTMLEIDFVGLTYSNYTTLTYHSHAFGIVVWIGNRRLLENGFKSEEGWYVHLSHRFCMDKVFWRVIRLNQVLFNS